MPGGQGVPPQSIAREPPLVGREDELRRLLGHLASLPSARVPVVAVAGETGVGKTRLVEEALRVTSGEGPIVLRGRCVGGAPAEPLLPFRVALQEVVTGKSTRMEAWRDLALDALQLAGPVGTGVYLLAKAFVRRDVLFGRARPPVEDDRGREKLFWHLVAVVRHLAAGPGVVLFVDDFHGADESSVAFLRFLAREMVGRNAQVVLCYTPEELATDDAAGALVQGAMADLEVSGLLTRISVGRLHVEAVGALVEGALGTASPDPGLVRGVWHTSEGNPLFALELLRQAVDEGRLCWSTTGGWRMVPADAVLSLPASLRDLVHARLRLLPQSARETLHCAAVLGPQFAVDILDDVCSSGDQVAADLDVLLARGLLVAQPVDERSLRFAHSQVQRVSYELLGPMRRRALHRRAGEALMRRWRGRRGEVAAQLARHQRAAGELRQAGAWHELAAAGARRAYAHADAAAALRSALDCALALDTRPPWRAERLRVRLAHELQRAGDLPEAERHVRLALEALAGGSPHPGLVADVRRQEGVSAFRRGEWSTAYDRWMEALHGYARAGNTLGRARVCNNIAAVHLHEGRYDQAREAFTHAQELAERCGATHTALRAHHNLGALHEAEGELDAAIAHYARCAMWAREADLKEDHWRALIGTAVCLLEKQPVDHGRVEELLDEALRLTEECHDERARAQVLRNRAYAQERAARYDEAVADYQACLDVFARLGERHWQASALGRLGLALCAAGSTVSGRAHVADALDRLSDLGDDTRVAAYRAELAGLLARGLGDAPASGGN